jgi:hypothetical protein
VLVPLVTWVSRHLPARVMERARLTPAVLYRHALSFVMIGLATVLAGLVFDTLSGVGVPPKQALGITLLVMLSPPLLFYSVLFFTELLSALVCFWVFQRLLWGGRHGASQWALTGSATGFLMLLHARNAGLILALTVIAVIKGWRAGLRAETAAFLAGVAALLLVRTAVNFHFWGSLVTNSHASLGAWTGSGELIRESLVRLGGLILDQEFGLVVYAPIYVLAAAGLVVMMKGEREAASAILFVTASYLALVICPLTNIQGWTGGWCPAARFLTPVVPLAAVPLSRAVRAVPRPVTVAVLVLQIGISAALWQFPKLAWNDGEGRAAFCARTGVVCEYLPAVTKW